MGGERVWMTSVCIKLFLEVFFLYKYSTFLCIPVLLRSIVVLKYGVGIISLIIVVGYTLLILSEVIWIRSIIKIIHYNIDISSPFWGMKIFSKIPHCVLIPKSKVWENVLFGFLYVSRVPNMFTECLSQLMVFQLMF